MNPDAAAMRAHAQAVFGGLPEDLRDGFVELAWTDPRTGSLRHGLQFGAADLEALVRQAAQLNVVEGQCVYIGAALRRPSTCRTRRAKDDDFYAGTCAYADFDHPGDVERAERICREVLGTAPSFVVFTGRHPHPRAQLWFRLREAQRDAAALRDLNKGIADRLHGDPAVVNVGRILRLAGGIAWPRKPGRVIELTEFVLPEGAV